jgi:hypothetical protein
MEVLEGKKMHLFQKKKRLRRKKKRIVHPLQRKEGLERKIISIHSKNKQRNLREKKCIHAKLEDDWRERGKKIVYPF